MSLSLESKNVRGHDFFAKRNSLCLNVRCIPCLQIKRGCVLNSIAAKHLRVSAPTVVLKDHAYGDLERAEFSGKVYPFIYSDWDGDYANTDYFSKIESLKMVDGSLRGDACWHFSGCTSLEAVYLSDHFDSPQSLVRYETAKRIHLDQTDCLS